MELEITSKKEKPLTERTEIYFKAIHPNESTPNREKVREKIASLLNAKKELVIIDSIHSDFGRMESIGYAKVYKSKAQILEIERKPILIRNKLIEAEKKEKKEVKKPSTAVAAAEKPEAKKITEEAEVKKEKPKPTEKKAEKPEVKKEEKKLEKKSEAAK